MLKAIFCREKGVEDGILRSREEAFDCGEGWGQVMRGGGCVFFPFFEEISFEGFGVSPSKSPF